MEPPYIIYIYIYICIYIYTPYIYIYNIIGPGQEGASRMVWLGSKRPLYVPRSGLSESSSIRLRDKHRRNHRARAGKHRVSSGITPIWPYLTISDYYRNVSTKNNVKSSIILHNSYHRTTDQLYIIYMWSFSKTAVPQIIQNQTIFSVDPPV